MDLRFEDPTPRRFVMVRKQDVSGISGTGKVASGCVWPDGSAVLHWNTETFSTTVFQDIADLEKLHGHDGATQIVYVDSEDSDAFDVAGPLYELVKTYVNCCTSVNQGIVESWPSADMARANLDVIASRQALLEAIDKSSNRL